MAKKVVLYSQPGCPPCQSAKEYLSRKGVELTVKDIAQDAEALNELITKGFNVTPVIFIGDQAVVGFNRAEIDALLQE